jgi:putative PIN family toxin of toxin-antitoxin system
VTSALLDSNVLLSGAVGFPRRESTPGALLRLWRADAFELVSSIHILGEVRRALATPYFRQRITPAQAGRFIALLTRRARVLEITAHVAGVASHPEDDLVLSAALTARVDFLVTGDRALQELRTYERIRIVAPAAFLKILDTPA